MKLGKDTGSLFNWMAGNSLSPTPIADMGATLLLWSDRYACTIHKVDLAGKVKKLWASEDIAKRTDSNGYFTEDQSYAYSNENRENPERWSLFTLRKDGRWHKGTTLHGTVLAIGVRMAYTDPTF